MIFRFEGFELNLLSRQLTLNGGPVRLVGKPFDVLVYLVVNRDRIVNGEELFAAVWNQDGKLEKLYDPQYIQQAIASIRRTLGDNSKQPTFIVTDRGRGVRFAASVVEVSRTASENSFGRSGLSRVLKLGWIAVAAIPIVAVMIPRFSGKSIQAAAIAPLTHTVNRKYAPVLQVANTLYYTELRDGNYTIMSVPSGGGDSSSVATSIQNPYACAISPDKSKLLVRSVVGAFDDYGPFFVQTLKTGQVVRLSQTGFDGTWMPDGNAVLLSQGNQLIRVNLRKLDASIFTTTPEGFCWWPRWSPDRKRLRFTVTEPKGQRNALWETDSDGKELHRVFPDTAPWGNNNCGDWTRDGRYFLFSVGPIASSSVWGIRERTRPFEPAGPPQQITSGPLSFRGPEPSADEEAIFARALLYRGAMWRFDLADGTEKPYLPDIFMDMLTYSPDHQRIVYCLADEDQSLWLAHADGSRKTRLVAAPLQSAFPQWSPDGTRIAVATRAPDQPWRISLVSPERGERTELKLLDSNAIHPSWFPDGNHLAFGMIPTLEPKVGDAKVFTVDLSTGQIATVPDSSGLFTPVVSPDGHFLAALRADSYRLMLYDFLRHNWRELTRTRSGYPAWSSDSQFIYFCSQSGSDPVIERISVQNQQVKKVVNLKGFPFLDRWLGIDPTGGVLAAKNVGIQEVYNIKLNSLL